MHWSTTQCGNWVWQWDLCPQKHGTVRWCVTAAPWTSVVARSCNVAA